MGAVIQSNNSPTQPAACPTKGQGRGDDEHQFGEGGDGGRFSRKGADDLQLIMGYAQFHDSYLNVINQIADTYKIDYRLLIMEVSKINKENPSQKLINEIALQLSKGNQVHIFSPKFYHKQVQ